MTTYQGGFSIFGPEFETQNSKGHLLQQSVNSVDCVRLTDLFVVYVEIPNLQRPWVFWTIFFRAKQLKTEI